MFTNLASLVGIDTSDISHMDLLRAVEGWAMQMRICDRFSGASFGIPNTIILSVSACKATAGRGSFWPNKSGGIQAACTSAGALIDIAKSADWSGADIPNGENETTEFCWALKAKGRGQRRHEIGLDQSLRRG
jgi:hypothetical protein